MSFTIGFVLGFVIGWVVFSRPAFADKIWAAIKAKWPWSK